MSTRLVNGLYIVIEGMVGSGKGTQTAMLTEYLRATFPEREIVRTFEPGGSEIANAIRKLVQGTEFEEEMSPMCDAYLYAAARAQTLSTIVKPNLEKGNIVVSDRNFISSLTIQGYAQGLGPGLVMQVNRPLLDLVFPDVVIQLDIKPEEGLNRTFDEKGDKFEKETLEFYKRVEQAYQEVSQYEMFQGKWLRVDVNDKTREEIHNEIKEKLQPYLTRLTNKNRTETVHRKEVFV